MANETKETFSGKTKDQTFDIFDEKVLTWCRKQFGDYYAKGLWHNTLTNIDNLNLDDEEDNFDFEMHLATVYEVLALKYSRVPDSGPRSGSSNSASDAGKESSATSRTRAQAKLHGN